MEIYTRNLSPFGRRVMLWASLQGLDYEQRPIQVVGEDFETLKKLNPSGRIPTVILDDGARLVDSLAIIDWFESIAPEDKRLLPSEPLARRAVMSVIANSNSACEKLMALVYERDRRPEEYRWPQWIERVEQQAASGLALIDEAAPQEGFFGGSKPNGADICAVVAFDFAQLMAPVIIKDRFAKLLALSERANASPDFERTHPKHT